MSCIGDYTPSFSFPPLPLPVPCLLLPGRGSATDLSSMSMTCIPPLLPAPSPQHPSAKEKPARHTRRRRPSSAESPTKLLLRKKKLVVMSQSSPTFGSPPKHKKKPIDTAESGIFTAPVNPNAEPGSTDWQYSWLPLELELARGLSGKWAGVEETYLGTLRRVFRLLRGEREEVCQYFYLRRSVHATTTGI